MSTKIAHQDPRVALFKQAYINSAARTFCNIYQSAIIAGYSNSYALNLSHLNPKWWQEMQEDASINRAEMLRLAEGNLKESMTISDSDDIQRLKIKHDASKFVSERIGKDHYSTRKELTDKGGKRLFNVTHTKDSQGALSDLFVNVEDTA